MDTQPETDLIQKIRAFSAAKPVSTFAENALWGVALLARKILIGKTRPWTNRSGAAAG
ncbi:MAG: hypothetical protein WCF20_14290 [Methylovirgula sp.]